MPNRSAGSSTNRWSHSGQRVPRCAGPRSGRRTRSAYSHDPHSVAMAAASHARLAWSFACAGCSRDAFEQRTEVLGGGKRELSRGVYSLADVNRHGTRVVLPKKSKRIFVADIVAGEEDRRIAGKG